MSILLDIADDMQKGSNINYECFLNEINGITDNNKKNTLYIVLGKEDVKVIDLDIEDDVEAFEYKMRLTIPYPANKMLLQGGEYSKKNMSITPLSIRFNSSKIIESFGDDNWEKFLIGVSQATFTKIKEEAKGDSYIEEILELEAECNEYMKSGAKELAGLIRGNKDNISVNIHYDIDISHYEKANTYFYKNMKKIFSNTNNIIEVDGISMGHSVYTNTSADKPTLRSNLFCSFEDVVKINSTRGNRKIKDLGYIQHVIKAKDDIYYWEYDSRESSEVIRKNAYIGKSRKYGIGEAAAWQFKSWFENEHGERKRWLMSILRLDIREPKAFKVIKREVMDRVIKDLIISDERANAISSLNNILSFQEWHNEKYGGVGLMELIKALQERQGWSGYEVKSLEEYSYMLGQVVYYVNSKSIEAKDEKKKTMRYAYKYLDTKNVSDRLGRDIRRYQSNIRRREDMGAIIAAIMSSKFDKVDKAMFLAGVMDNNIFYKKKEAEETIENTNTIKGEI